MFEVIKYNVKLNSTDCEVRKYVTDQTEHLAKCK